MSCHLGHPVTVWGLIMVRLICMINKVRELWFSENATIDLNLAVMVDLTSPGILARPMPREAGTVGARMPDIISVRLTASGKCPKTFGLFHFFK